MIFANFLGYNLYFFPFNDQPFYFILIFVINIII